MAALCVLFGRVSPDGLADRSSRSQPQKAALLWSGRQGLSAIWEDENGFQVSEDRTLTVEYDAETAGTYEIWLNYKAEEALYADLSWELSVGSQSISASSVLAWEQGDGERPLDRYGDELNTQPTVSQFPLLAVLQQPDDVSKGNLKVSLPEGHNRISVACSAAVRVFGVYIAAGEGESALPKSGEPQSGSQIISVEAENFVMKSDSYIRGKNVKNPALSPYDTYQEKINVIDAASWSKVGQKILWMADVEQAGWYRIGFRYSQYSDNDKCSYRRLWIDGESVTADAVAFPSTGMNSYRNLTVAEDGKDVWVYLGAGEHTIAMQATMDPLLAVYSKLVEVMNGISDVSMDLRKLTAGSQDPNRTWDMEQYLPDVPAKLTAYKKQIEGIYGELWAIGNAEPSYAGRLNYAVRQLENLLKDERLIPNKAGMLSEGDGSVNSALGEVLEKLVYTPLSLDRIYFYQNTDLPAASCNMLVHAVEGVKRLAETYLPDAGGADYTAVGGDTEDLQVWVNMPISYTEILQAMIDEQYNQTHGTAISLALMPNEQKLILANATGKNPDVVIGVNFYTPYELAIRGAAKNLLEYEDFASYYSEQYNIAGLVPLAYDGGIYGAVDSLNYQILFYRKDILEDLGLDVPETWENVENMMPVLLRYSMNVCTSLATGGSFKTFNATEPFLYQNGAAFYAPDGGSVAFNNEAGKAAFQQMTDLYKVYSLSESVANFFNSFRYGETPLGVGNFSTYVQLLTAAPELSGKWGIALVPGQRQSDGSVAYYQAADSTASMISNNTDKPDEAWEFLKWWLAGETQTEFSNRLESAYGAGYRWNTANLKAFESLPYPKGDREVILRQLSYQKETGRHPAGYMVEREVSNTWNQVVVNGKGLTESIDRAVIASDREIIRKLQEFNFMDEDGNMIKPYTTEEIASWMGQEKGGASDEKAP